MAISRAVKTEFLRKVYSAAPASSAARDTYLDGLSTTALASRAAGKLLSGTAFGGTSASYSAFSGWHPDQVIELIAWARDYIAEDAIADALALVSPMVRSFQIRTTNLHVNG